LKILKDEVLDELSEKIYVVECKIVHFHEMKHSEIYLWDSHKTTALSYNTSEHLYWKNLVIQIQNQYWFPETSSQSYNSTITKILSLLVRVVKMSSEEE